MAAATPVASRSASAERGTRHLRPLTGLRGLAAVWVLLCHASYFFDGPQTDFDQPGRWLQLGWVGVLVFFVLSGFLLALPFVAHARGEAARPDTGHYLLRRLFRVFPAYWAQLAVLAMGSAWLGWAYWPGETGAWLVHLTMAFNLGTDPVRPVVGVWWTLPVELCFYLCLPVLAPLLRWRHGVLWLLAIGLVAAALLHIAAWPLPWPLRTELVTQFPGVLILFLTGVAVAWYRPAVERLWLRRPGASTWCFAWSVTALVALLALIPLTEGGREFWTTPWLYFGWKPTVGIVIAGLLLASLDPAGPAARVLGGGWAMHLGEISYSLYLWHLPIVLALVSWPDHAPGWQRWSLALTATWLLAWLSTRWIERPGIQLGRRLTQGSPTG